jgi:type III pantothenate kinase
MSTLLIDIGNTSASVGYSKHGKIVDTGRCPSRFQDANELEPLLTQHSVSKVVLASVVPTLDAQWIRALEKLGLPYPLQVNHRLELGVKIDYPQPDSIGADRLANAAAAAFQAGTPSVVCDFGTALTFDVLHASRGYIGGIICPGLPLMFDYLSEKTALLPRVKPSKTEAVVGRNTPEAMQIGARLGYRGMVREILTALQTELDAPHLPVLCTGGYAKWIFEEWDFPVSIDPLLTLRGLARIAELNHPQP